MDTICPECADEVAAGHFHEGAMHYQCPHCGCVFAVYHIDAFEVTPQRDAVQLAEEYLRQLADRKQ